MRNYIFLLIIFIFSLLQITFLDSFRILNVKPDLLLISVVIASLIFELKWALVFSVFCGILKDILGLNSLGINTSLFALYSFIVVRLSKKISIDNSLMRALLIFIIVIFNSIITQLIFFSLSKSLVSFGIFLRIAFLESLYTAMIFPLIFKIIGSLTFK